MAKKFGGRRRNYITKLARIVVAYLVRNRKLPRIHVAIFLRTATKNKKLLAGGIQSESSRSNCDIANLDTTAKKNTM